MDVNKLLKALDDETNENLFNFTSDKMIQLFGQYSYQKIFDIIYPKDPN